MRGLTGEGEANMVIMTNDVERQRGAALLLKILDCCFTNKPSRRKMHRRRVSTNLN